MKVVLLIGGETPLDLLFLNLLLREKIDVEWCVGVEIGTPFKMSKIKKYILAFRNCGFRFMLFNSLINLPFGRLLLFRRSARIKSVEQIAADFRVGIFYFSQINSAKTLKQIRQYQPELILNHMPQIVRNAELFSLARFGFVNIHPGLLPDYQGLGSCLWPLIENRKYHGSTLHTIDSEAIDKGPILLAGRSEIGTNDSVFNLNVKCRRIAVKLVLRLIDRLKASKKSLPTLQQIDGKYRRLPNKSQLRQMALKHPYFCINERQLAEESDSLVYEVKDSSTNWGWVSGKA